MKRFKELIFLMVAIGFSHTRAGIVQTGANNWASTIDGVEKEYYFVKYYSKHCSHSKAIATSFKETAREFEKEQKIGFAQVNCDDYSSSLNGAQKCYDDKIDKLPTLRLFHRGTPVRQDYRGKLNAPSLVKYLKFHLDAPVKTAKKLDMKLDTNERNVVLLMKERYADSSGGEQIAENLKILASRLKGDCTFTSYVGNDERIGEYPYQIRFMNVGEVDYVEFEDDAKDMDELSRWVEDGCVPLAEEITPENAVYVTGSNLPLLVLFQHPDDEGTLKEFLEAVNDQLDDHRQSLKAVFADGTKFEPVLEKLGKKFEDLPFMVIDDFKHVYPYTKALNKIRTGKALRKFSYDLYSGELHRRFKSGSNHESTVHESVFADFRPSEKQYTFWQYEHDEL